MKIPLRLIEDDEDAVINEEPDESPDVPLIILFEGHRFRSYCKDRFLSFMRREKINSYWAFVFVSNKEYNYYLNNFGKQFQAGEKYE